MPDEARSDLLGKASHPRPPGRLVWMHLAASARHTPLLALADRIAEEVPETSFLFTSEHTVGEAVASATGRVLCPPLDLPGPVSAFLDHWQPDVSILAGNLPGPILMGALGERGRPVFVVDGERFETGPGWGWITRKGCRGLLQGVTRFFPATQDARQYLVNRGTVPAKIGETGFLDDHGTALPCNERERASLAELLSARPVWLAASVPPAEIDLMERAHRLACRFSHRLLLILVPSRPDGGESMRDRLSDLGWRVALRSEGAEPDPEVQVYIADTEGEMGLWYRLAPITFLAGSLLPPGRARDPYEPAALGSAVLCGSYMGAVAPSSERLSEAGAARRVAGPEDLGAAVGDLLSPDKAALMAHRAWETVSAGVAISDRVLEVVLSGLMEKEAADARA